MAVLKSGDNKEIIVSCCCGCDDGIHIEIVESENDYALATYTNGNFYNEQYGALGTLREKLRKILAIIGNKDYYYSDIIMSKDDFQMFKEWVNQFGR